jgi:Domain of unknown function (DUF4189)
VTRTKAFFLALALGLAAMLIGAEPARATCCAPGTSGMCLRSSEGECQEYCEVCIGPVPGYSTPAPAPNYGAIAYGPSSQAWGYSYHWDTQAQAESTAMKNCGQHGADCEVAVWFKQQCGAVVSDAGTTYYWGLGATTQKAVAEAKNSCAKGGGKICQQQVAYCSQ